jgi:PAS domain S-box-containing protein
MSPPPATPDFAALFDASPAPLLVLDPGLTIVAANRAYHAATLTRPGDILGRPVFDAFPDDPDDPNATGVRNLRASLQRVLATRATDAMPVLRYAVQRPDGGYEERFWSTVNTPVLGPDGRVRWILNRPEDITDHVRAAASIPSAFAAPADVHAARAVRRSEALLRVLTRKLRFLSELADATRHLADPVEVMAVATRMVCRHLAASRCAYADVEPDADRFTIPADYSTDGLPSSAGAYRLSLFGPRAAADQRAGRTLVVRDVDREMTGPEGADTFTAIGIKAIVCCPLVKDGRLAAMMAVHQTTPRDWSPEEVDLVESAADRCWAYIERARATQQLRLARDDAARHLADLRAVVGSMTEGLITADADGNVLDWNPAALAMHGLTPADPVHQHLSRFLDTYDLCTLDGRVLPLDEWPMARALRGDTFRQYELVVRHRRTGDERIISYSGAPVRDPATDRVARAVLSLHDNTARRRTEQRLRAVLQATPECVKVVAPDGTLEYMNAAGLGIIDADSENQVRDACTFDLIAPEHRDLWRANHARVCRGERLSWEFEIVTLKGNRRWMETHAVPLPTPDGRLAQLAVTRDVTARKRTEREREQLLAAEQTARAAAERASRMKDEFLATLSHELRTPLNAIVGWAQLLRMDGLTPDEAREGVDVIDRNARAQARLIEDLLDMSRIVNGSVRLDVQPVDLVRTVAAAADTVRPAADAKGVHLHTALDPRATAAAAATTVNGDPNRLQQVLWNLLTNAVKFTPAGGHVHVALQRDDNDNAAAATAGRDALRLTVTDTGQGIAPQFLPHVFERFRQQDATTTRQHGGLGLGLAIVKHLVEMHGGTIAAHSAGPGAGATFTVTLPAATPAPPPAPADPARPASATAASSPPQRLEDCEPLDGVRVLIVDDEPDARTIVRRTLERCGATVTTAASAREALLIAREQPFDVLLSDIAMPDEDGYAFIQQLRQLPTTSPNTTTPAAALTAFARPEDRQRAVAAGYETHIPKPVEPATLVTTVASLTRRRTAPTA